MLVPRFYFMDDFTSFEPLIAEYSTQKTYPKQIWLSDATLPDRTSYYIASGIAKFSAVNEHGEEIIFFFMGRGSIFPINCMDEYFTLEPYLQLSTVTDCTVLEFPSMHFEAMMARNSKLAAATVNHYCKYTNLLLARSLINSYRDTEQRIISFLYLYLLNNPDCDCSINLSQEEIGAITGVSLPQVTRVIKKLRESGVICNRRRHIAVNDLDKLGELCNDMVRVNSMKA